MHFLQSPGTCPGATVNIHVNIFDASSGTKIGYWNDTVPHTANISTSRSPNKITVPREQHVNINVIVENAMGSALWHHSMSSKKHNCYMHSLTVINQTALKRENKLNNKNVLDIIH